MAKRRQTPGTIYKPGNCNTLYIKIKGKRHATGLPDTPQNRKLAERLKEEIWYSLQGYSQFVMPTRTTPTFYEAWQYFKREYCTERQLSSRTIDNYRAAFERVVRSEYERITSGSIEQWLQLLSVDTKLAASSVNIYLRDVGVFLGYCATKGWIQSIDVSRYRRKTTRKSILVLSTKQESAVLKRFFSREDPFSLLVQWYHCSGWRPSQVLNMKPGDIADEWIKTLSKNKKEVVYYPMTGRARRILTDVRRVYTSTDSLWPWSYNSSSTLSKQLRDVFDELQISVPGESWKIFRKTAATRWSDAGLPEKDVQFLLGHSGGSVAQIHYMATKVRELRIFLENLDQKLTHI